MCALRSLGRAKTYLNPICSHPWRDIDDCVRSRPGPAARRFPLRWLVRGISSVACPFGGTNVDGTFVKTPPHPWLGVRRRACTVKCVHGVSASRIAMARIDDIFRLYSSGFWLPATRGRKITVSNFGSFDKFGKSA